jgi:transcriptional regulator with XRE-family HTH domain
MFVALDAAWRPGYGDRLYSHTDTEYLIYHYGMNGGEVIKMARYRAGLTQLQLARRLDRQQATIARWEGGERRPSFEDVQAATSACGLQFHARLAPEDRSWWASIAAALEQESLVRLRDLSPPAITDPVVTLEALAEISVPAVVIGEIAGALQGWPLVLGRGVVEVCIQPGELSAAIDRYARAGGDGARLTGALSGEYLAVTQIPSGTEGFRDLARDAEIVETPKGQVRVASVLDLLRIADASPEPEASRAALAHSAVLDVLHAQKRETATL